MSSTFEQARDFFLRGVGHYETGELAQAEREFAAALALVPGRVSTLTNLGAVRLKLGRAEEAAALFDEALALEPSNVEALRHRAAALAELGSRAGACRDRPCAGAATHPGGLDPAGQHSARPRPHGGSGALL